MKLKLKEDPREWRKITWLTAGGLVLVSSLLCWRKILPVRGWEIVLVAAVAASLAAWVRPGWFRGFYRVSSRVGYWLGQMVGSALLAAVFLLVVTPLGLGFRLFGKDLLRLKSRRDSPTYWTESRPSTPLERLF